MENNENNEGTNCASKLATAWHVSDSMVSLPDNFWIKKKDYEKLYEHQKIGVKWLYDLYRTNQGAILADDMGMGKTLQTSTLLTGLLLSRKVSRVLIVCPVAIVESWKRQLSSQLGCNKDGKTALNDLQLIVITADMQKKKRNRIIDCIFQGLPITQSKSKATSKKLNKEVRYVVISTYDIVANSIESFSQCDNDSNDDSRKWDCVILDEGHVIKNPQSKKSMAMYAIESKWRLLLTGTPIHNNLDDLWTLMDWVSQRSILGGKNRFDALYKRPIEAANDRNASTSARLIGKEAADSLWNKIKPFILQRKKNEAEFFEEAKMTKKTEIVMLLSFSDRQKRMYEEFLDSYRNREKDESTHYPVEAISHLRTISRHPMLLILSQCRQRMIKSLKSQLQRMDDTSDSDSCHDDDDIQSDGHDEVAKVFRPLIELRMKTSYDDDTGDYLDWMHQTADVDDLKWLISRLNMQDNNSFSDEVIDLKELLKIGSWNSNQPAEHEMLNSCFKIRFARWMINQLKSRGHRILIFRMLLDILERLLHQEDEDNNKTLETEICRLDGSVSGLERQEIVDKFNQPTSPLSVCLLTTKACGYGINLIGADRVIIFDPSWNPAEDKQAIDRAYRIGQTRNVVVYRLIYASVIEEKIFEKQVFKDYVRMNVLEKIDQPDCSLVDGEEGDAGQATSDTFQGYFSRSEIRQLFTSEVHYDQSTVIARIMECHSDEFLLSNFQVDSLRQEDECLSCVNQFMESVGENDGKIIGAFKNDVFSSLTLQRGTKPTTAEIPNKLRVASETTEKFDLETGPMYHINKILKKSNPPIRRRRIIIDDDDDDDDCVQSTDHQLEETDAKEEEAEEEEVSEVIDDNGASLVQYKHLLSEAYQPSNLTVDVNDYKLDIQTLSYMISEGTIVTNDVAVNDPIIKNDDANDLPSMNLNADSNRNEGVVPIRRRRMIIIDSDEEELPPSIQKSDVPVAVDVVDNSIEIHVASPVCDFNVRQLDSMTDFEEEFDNLPAEESIRDMCEEFADIEIDADVPEVIGEKYPSIDMMNWFDKTARTRPALLLNPQQISMYNQRIEESVSLLNKIIPHPIDGSLSSTYSAQSIARLNCQLVSLPPLTEDQQPFAQGALSSLLQALELCDDQVSLHTMICVVRLACINSNETS